MKKIVIIIICLFILLSAVNLVTSKPIKNNDSISVIDHSIDSSVIDNPQEQQVIQNINRLGGYFTENRGQVTNDSVRYYIQGKGIWFTDEGVVFEISKEIEAQDRDSGFAVRNSRLAKNPKEFIDLLEPIEYERVILNQKFIGANPVRPIGRERLDWNSNFFYGNESSKWYKDVPIYREIYYENLYNGIDLRYYKNEDGLKYDFIVHPGANIQQIKVGYIGANGLEIDDLGNLIIKTNIKDIVDRNLFIYQYFKGMQHQINGRFVKINNLEYSFELVGDYNSQELLVIDPQLEYSTYMGGNGIDRGWSIAVDSVGNTFVTGLTTSTDFPNTTGAFNTTNGGLYDVFVLKLNYNGSNLLYSTYIGGGDLDTGWAIELDSDGNAILAGETSSTDFPTTYGVIDTTFDGKSEVFVLKLNHNGSNLKYSTFIGGAGNESGRGLSIDNMGNTFITGWTSGAFPTTSNASNTSHNGGTSDCFILKLNHNASALLYSTYMGGDNVDEGHDIEIDSTGNAFVVGFTGSSNFPTTPNAFNTSFNNGDVFILKLNHNGSNLIYSTFVGGSSSDGHVTDLTIDADGNAFVTGHTYSNDFPTTPGANDTSYNGGGYDAFALKLDQNGSNLIYSTYIGGSDGCEGGTGIVIDPLGNAYVTGWTWSTNFPTTPDAYDLSYNGGIAYGDCFLIRLNPDGSKLNYSTYIGGIGGDPSHDIAMDRVGNIYFTGYTASFNFTNTSEAYDTTFNGIEDAFVSKFSFEPNFKIISIEVLLKANSTDQIYSRLSPYTFRVNIISTEIIFDLETVRLNLDPSGTNLQLLWNHTTGEFLEISDPNNFITIEPSSMANFYNEWVIDFNMTFNWTYPDEHFHDVQAYVTGGTFSPEWFNASKLYRVENDLIFNGTLTVKGKDNKTILENELVPAGEKLNWTGLYPVYENTTDIFPPDDEYDISLWDEDENVLFDSPESGQPFNMTTITPSTTDSDGYNYTINLTGIPLECDKTNCTFTIRIDGDNVTFSDFRPETDNWQTTSDVEVGVTVTDIGGAHVDGSSIMHSVSMDDGSTWSGWELVANLENASSIIVQDLVTLDDGPDNYIKWRAKDTLGNGPTESVPHMILVDTEDVVFTNPLPLPTAESPYEEVEVGITISDNTSGVNASTIKYSISYDAGKSWNEWLPVLGIESGKPVNIKLNLTFPNGTNNRIRWYSFDIAGNGPAISEEYIIKINKSSLPHPLSPEVMLISPSNNTIIQTTSVELSWRLINTTLQGVLFDVIFDTNYPPAMLQASNLIQEIFTVNDLEDGETYYWKVVPKAGNITGLESETWRFTVKRNYTPQFGLELRLEPMKIELFPGETKYVKAVVTNLGELDDNIGIKVNGTIPEVLNLTFNHTTISGVTPDNTAEFNITITATMDAQKCELQIIIIANSGKAAEHHITVEDNATLTINILELDKPGTDKSSSIILLWIILAITIIIIILIVIGIILRRKKQVEEKKISPSEAVSVAPDEEELEE